jgi:hypothetical protein
MQTFVDFLIKYASYPANWIIKALGLPDSLTYSRYFIANLLVVFLLMLAWWAFTLWRRRKYVFYLALYLFLVMSAVVGFIATIVYRHAWVYAILVILLSLLIYVVFHRGIHPKPEHRRFLRRFLVLGIILSFGMPIAFSLRQERRHINEYNDLFAGLEKQKTQVSTYQTQAETSALTLSTDPQVLAAYGSGNLSLIMAELQSLQQSQNLGFIILTDALGQVMYRTDAPSKRFDNYFERHTWAGPLYINHTPVSGLAYDEDGHPMVIAGQVVNSNGKTIGGIWVGRYINPNLTQTLIQYTASNLAVAVEKGVTSPAGSGNSQEIQLFSLAEFDQGVRQRILFSPNTREEVMIRYGSKVFLLAGLKITTLSADQPIWLISAKEDIQEKWLPLLDLAIVLGIGLAVIFLLSFSKKLLFKIMRIGDKKDAAAPATPPAADPTPPEKKETP